MATSTASEPHSGSAKRPLGEHAVPKLRTRHQHSMLITLECVHGGRRTAQVLNRVCTVALLQRSQQPSHHRTKVRGAGRLQSTAGGPTTTPDSFVAQELTS